jgi:hypothetical protein
MAEAEAETETEPDLPSYSPAAPIQTYLSKSQQMLANKGMKVPIKNAQRPNSIPVVHINAK